MARSPGGGAGDGQQRDHRELHIPLLVLGIPAIGDCDPAVRDDDTRRAAGPAVDVRASAGVLGADREIYIGNLFARAELAAGGGVCEPAAHSVCLSGAVVLLICCRHLQRERQTARYFHQYAFGVLGYVLRSSISMSVRRCWQWCSRPHGGEPARALVISDGVMVFSVGDLQFSSGPSCCSRCCKARAVRFPKKALRQGP